MVGDSAGMASSCSTFGEAQARCGVRQRQRVGHRTAAAAAAAAAGCRRCSKGLCCPIAAVKRVPVLTVCGGSEENARRAAQRGEQDARAPATPGLRVGGQLVKTVRIHKPQADAFCAAEQRSVSPGEGSRLG